MKKLILTVLFAVLFGGNSFAQDCSPLDFIFFLHWECNCSNDEAYITLLNNNPGITDTTLEFTIDGVVMTDSITVITVPIQDSYLIEVVADNGCVNVIPVSPFTPESNSTLECLNDGLNNCVNDGDCSNGIEIFDDENCDCVSLATIEGCVVPGACNYNPEANCPTECIFGEAPSGQACDDGDPTTVNDIIDCDGNCVGQSCASIAQSCVDDGDPINGVEVYNAQDCTCSIEPASFGCTDLSACNFDPNANVDNGCLYPNGPCQTNSTGTYNANCECIINGVDIECNDLLIQSVFSCEPNNGLFTYTFTVTNPNNSDPLATYNIIGTGIANPLAFQFGEEASFTYTDGTEVSLNFSDGNACVQTFNSGGPVACSAFGIGGACDDDNPFTYNDTYDYYGCVGTPCTLNEFACPDDGDCSNGFETFDLETCQCISVGDCADEEQCDFVLDFTISVSGDFSTADVTLVISQGQPNSIYTISYDQVMNSVTTDANGTASITFILDCIELYDLDFSAVLADSNCQPEFVFPNCGGLPIDLLYFAGETVGNHNRIFWSTGSENDSDQFILERSNNGETNWKAIANIAAAGNSSVTQSYELWDYEANAAINYYRLKERSLDGNISVVSNIVVLQRDASSAPVFEVYPNPTNNLLSINLSANASQEGLLELRTMDGRTILRKQTIASETINTLDLSTLSPGFYLLSFRQGDLMISQKVLKY